MGLLRLAWNRTAPAFDSWAPRYENDAARLIEARGYSYQALARRVVEALSIAPGDTVLEIGTGPGNLGKAVADIAPQTKLVGIDISTEMLRRACEQPFYGSVTRASFERLPFPAQSFDAVYSAFVLHSVYDQQRAFSELDRVLRADGRAALIDLCPTGRSKIVTPAAGFIHSILRERGAPARYRPIGDYCELALKTNFEVVSARPLGQPRKYMHYFLAIRKIR
jgi:ubiquinone/menaquinone biosynthesis C-methylase UbiE